MCQVLLWSCRSALIDCLLAGWLRRKKKKKGIIRSLLGVF